MVFKMRIKITIEDWIYEKYIKEKENKSEYIKELIIERETRKEKTEDKRIIKEYNDLKRENNKLKLENGKLKKIIETREDKEEMRNEIRNIKTMKEIAQAELREILI